MLPGSYTVRLSAGGKTLTQPLNVAMDPRVEVTQEELVSLLEFQRQLEQLLTRTVKLAQLDAFQETTGDTPESVAETLTGLAIDLEHADAPPTEPQRALLKHESARLERLEKSLSELNFAADR